MLSRANRTELARGRRQRPGPLGLTGAVLCFVACAAMALYGIYLIIPQFH